MDPANETLALLDYRRRASDLYRTVRMSPPVASTWDAWRTGRDELFATHSQSPLNAADSRREDGVRYFEHDTDWRFFLEVEPVEADDVDAAHSGAGTTPLKRFGQVTLPVDGGTVLSLFRFDQYGDGIFVPFRDRTAGTSTYGGGRYLLDSQKGADLGSDEDHVVLDFNYAYHPSCVYSDRWSCPLSPRDNWLQIPVPAGERL